MMQKTVSRVVDQGQGPELVMYWSHAALRGFEDTEIVDMASWGKG